MYTVCSCTYDVSKKEHCRSKDDAWVDILVASHSRHASNQDAELQCTSGSLRPRNIGHQDLKMASLKVIQVLVGVCGPSPALDGETVDIEPMNILHCSKIDSWGSPLKEQYATMIPGSLDLIEPVEVPEVELGLNICIKMNPYEAMYRFEDIY
jgi:hypothetical protein